MAFLRLVKTYQKILAALFGILFIIVGTLAALRWAKGDRFNFGGREGPTLTGTGLLVANSDPKGAQVYLNGKLTTATDDTLNLPPGSYEVEIKKDGFLPWKKKLEVVAELVTQTTAKLFPSVPNLTPLTFTGASEPIPSPDGQKIVYKVNEADNEAKNGLWILELSERNFAVARASEPKQIGRNTSQYDFSIAKLVWTPDSGQVLAYWIDPDVGGRTSDNRIVGKLKSEIRNPKSEIRNSVLLATGSMNDEGDLKDVSARLPVLLSQWHQDLDEKDMVRIKELPEFMQEVATASAQVMYFSPDEKRILYSPTKNLTIPEGLVADLPAESTQPEERDVKKDNLYVYDIEEDKNYKISDVGDRRSDIGKSESANPTIRDPKSEIRNPEPEDYWQKRLADDRIRWQEAAQSTEGSPDSAKASTGKEGQEGRPPRQTGLPPRQTGLPPVPEELLAGLLAKLSDRYSPIWQLPVQWFPTSAHLLFAPSNGAGGEDGISIVEYDGTNNSVVYSGPSQGNFVYPWPNGSRLVILTNFNDQNSPTNLYAINLK